MSDERVDRPRVPGKRLYVPPCMKSHSSNGLAPLLMATPPGPGERCCSELEDIITGCPVSGVYPDC
ncbi:MAG: hypothetical protein Q8L48_18335 [Archangium sp.]|nr:hypothetical protein [Archangium sp.]